MNTPQPNCFAAARGLWTLTWRTKLTWKRLLPLIGNMAAIPAFASFVIEPGEVRNFYYILIDLYLFLVVPIFCLSNFGAMIRDELQGDTMTFLITRPVTRARVFLLKYVALTLWLQIIVFGNGVAFWAAGSFLRVPDIGSLITLLIMVQALAVVAFGALTSLIGLFTQKYLIAGVVYGFIVEFGIGQIPTNINVLSISRHLKTFMARNPELASLYDWTTEGSWSSLMIVLGGTVLFLLLGALLFTFREYHHTEEVQKGS
ncbi:MAG: hypothetical protein M2R45_05225 [Verrucomicrobia subdivision 3 bacterium]|nr:hypothetical protein [Limisphaerales bacterium]MCS1417459.1 hypothetical protein [Limisphaerales bacterium]